MSESLINKYRPSAFEECIGQEHVLNPLQRAMNTPSHPHAYMLSGIRGTGKTTIARIIGRFFQCDINEIDAASNSGVEKARQMVAEAQYMSMHGNGNKMYLIDEAHRLSANAWDALLKIIEEPPNHLYFAMCTTALGKVPDTILSRCYKVNVKPLDVMAMAEYLQFIAETEGWQVVPDVINAIISMSDGSPRTALTLLQSTHDATSTQEVKRIITLIETSDPLTKIIHLIFTGKYVWREVKECLQNIDDEVFNDESGLMQAGRYLAAIIRRGDPREAEQAWRMLHVLMRPRRSFDNKAVFYDAIGSYMWEK